MTLTDKIVKDIIRKLIKGEDYRIEIVTLIDAEFLQYAIEFFGKVVNAKLKNKNINIDWYQKELLNPYLPKNDIAINSGLNMKTISNMYNTAKKEIVLEAATEHYAALYKAINSLVESGNDINITLTIKLRQVSIDLDLNESLIVINTLAVKRAALRGGLWSTAGKRVEKPLMKTLCMLFNVPTQHYDQNAIPSSLREVDFYLIGQKPQDKYKCEVKLMGKGNPESADAAWARGSRIIIADKLSDKNKKQLNDSHIEWVELRNGGFKRFQEILTHLSIAYQSYSGNLDTDLEAIFRKIFNS